jgi:manganese/zinc/iron transport system ATP- binding protein
MMHVNQNKNNYAFEADQLSVNYEKNPVLWDVSLQIPSGLLVGVIGPNGAGKSTLIKTALGLVKPLSGSITFFGQPLEKTRQKVAYVPQRESVDWDFPITVLELVMMGSYGKLGLFKIPGSKIKQKAEEILDKVGMLAYKNRQISQLSGGQQQRVFIARALMQDADLYFMDEPFVGIDFATSKVIWNILVSLKNEGKTLVIVHHDLSSINDYFDWIVMLNMRLVASGPVAQTFTNELVHKTYGQSHELFGEASLLSQVKTSGFSN